MKTNVKSSPRKRSSGKNLGGRPRVLSVESERINFFIDAADRSRVDALRKRSRLLKGGDFAPGKLTMTYIYREGGRRFMVELEKQLKAAEQGEFHAKKRS